VNSHKPFLPHDGNPLTDYRARQSVSCLNSPTFNAQVATWQLAQRITGDHRVVTRDPIEELGAPFNLRLARGHRSQAAQTFRDLVARHARAMRTGNYTSTRQGRPLDIRLP